MRRNEVTMWQVVLLATLSSAALIVAANLDPIRQAIVTLIFVAVGVICGVCSLVALALYVLHSVALSRKEWNQGARYGDIMLSEQENERIRLVLQCAPEQLQALGEIRARIAIIPGEHEPTYQVILGDQVVDWGLVQLFVDGCTKANLCPIGDYGEGSAEREAIQVITAYLIQKRLATPARGNQPAKFLDRDAAMAAIGHPTAPAAAEPAPVAPGWNAFAA